eukprot:g15994.t1
MRSSAPGSRRAAGSMMSVVTNGIDKENAANGTAVVGPFARPHGRGSKTLAKVRELFDAKAAVEEADAETAKEEAAKAAAAAKAEKDAAKAARAARASNRAVLKDKNVSTDTRASSSRQERTMTCSRRATTTTTQRRRSTRTLRSKASSRTTTGTLETGGRSRWK